MQDILVKHKNPCPPRLAVVVVLLLLVSGLMGCSPVVPPVPKVEPKPAPKKVDAKIEVANVVNASGQEFNFDVVKMFSNALAKALTDEALLWDKDSGSDHIILSVKILEYQQGNAFKRLLLPGWGATVLAVQGDMKESSTGKLIDSVQARRTVATGGRDTRGAWSTIFAQVGKDLVGKLQSRLRPAEKSAAGP